MPRFLTSPSPLRGEGWGEGRVLAKALPISVGAHPVRDRRGDRYAAVAHWVRSYGETAGKAFRAPAPYPSPLPGGEREKVCGTHCVPRDATKLL